MVSIGLRQPESGPALLLGVHRHALRILRLHGMQAESIHTIYQAVVIAKLTYASSAWWGFTTATDRQRLEAVIRRGIRSGLSSSNQSPLAEIVEDADDNPFSQVLYNNSHVLKSLTQYKHKNIQYLTKSL